MRILETGYKAQPLRGTFLMQVNDIVAANPQCQFKLPPDPLGGGFLGLRFDNASAGECMYVFLPGSEFHFLAAKPYGQSVSYGKSQIKKAIKVIRTGTTAP